MQNKTLFFLGGVGFILFIIMISYLTLSNKYSSSTPQIEPTIKPTTYPIGDGQPAEDREYQEVTPENEIRFQQDTAVSTFIKSLPYKGSYVRVDYSYDDNSFTIRKDPDQLVLAEQELSDLFNQYKIKEAIKAYTVVEFNK